MLNPRTAAVLRVLGFREDERNAVTNETEFVHGEMSVSCIVSVPDKATPADIVPALINFGREQLKAEIVATRRKLEQLTA